MAGSASISTDCTRLLFILSEGRTLDDELGYSELLPLQLSASEFQFADLLDCTLTVASSSLRQPCACVYRIVH